MYKLEEKKQTISDGISRILLCCRECVLENYPDAKVILFGSAARGQNTPESDIDLLILVGSDISEKNRIEILDKIYEISLHNDVVISAIIKPESVWKMPISKATGFYKSVQDEGVLVA